MGRVCLLSILLSCLGVNGYYFAIRPSFFQPLLNARLFSLMPWLVIAPPFQAFGQIFLKLYSRGSFGVFYLHFLIVVMSVLVVFAVIEVFHQLRRSIAYL